MSLASGDGTTGLATSIGPPRGPSLGAIVMINLRVGGQGDLLGRRVQPGSTLAGGRPEGLALTPAGPGARVRDDGFAPARAAWVRLPAGALPLPVQGAVDDEPVGVGEVKRSMSALARNGSPIAASHSRGGAHLTLQQFRGARIGRSGASSRPDRPIAKLNPLRLVEAFRDTAGRRRDVVLALDRGCQRGGKWCRIGNGFS
jgi:hypothetical protein